GVACRNSGAGRTDRNRLRRSDDDREVGTRKRTTAVPSRPGGRKDHPADRLQGRPGAEPSRFVGARPGGNGGALMTGLSTSAPVVVMSHDHHPGHVDPRDDRAIAAALAPPRRDLPPQVLSARDPDWAADLLRYPRRP